MSMFSFVFSAVVSHVALLALAALSCANGPTPPASLDTRNESCAFCRMTVSDARFAAQLVAPGEEPKFFDDVGCLRNYLARATSLPSELVAYVADHRSKEWVPAVRAVYTKVVQIETPMGSHIIAHADQASRERDPDAANGSPVGAGEILGPLGGAR